MNHRDRQDLQSDPNMQNALEETASQAAKTAVDRRDFIRGLAGMFAAASVGLGLSPAAMAQQAGNANAASSSTTTAAGSAAAGLTQGGVKGLPSDNLVGIQMGPHTMMDEGIEHVLDLIQETAGINAMFVYSHGYGGNFRKAPNGLAQDHGQPPPDQRTRNLPQVYVRQDEKYFKDTTLRHQKVDDTFLYHERDLFKEMVEPAKKRGIKIYARILEAGSRTILNFSKVAMVTATGRKTGTGCWNHPEYIAFWNATAEDLFRSYELDGFQWGAERASPLTNIIQNGNDNSATCFCEFCKARGKASGIDAERARQGFEDVTKYVKGLRDGGKKPADGCLAGFLHVLMRYPEVLAWERMYRQSREDIMKGMYGVVKKIKPTAPVGWHYDHWASSMDMIARATMSFEEMAPWSDYQKVVVYHAVTAPRLQRWVENEQKSVLGDMTLNEALDLHDDLFGYDKKTMPRPDRPIVADTWPEYVYRETKHSVASAAGKSKIYPGIGFNIYDPVTVTDDEETIYRVVQKAYEAGAAGIVASREYEEMTVPNLKAVGKAVRDLKKA